MSMRLYPSSTYPVWSTMTGTITPCSRIDSVRASRFSRSSSGIRLGEAFRPPPLVSVTEPGLRFGENLSAALLHHRVEFGLAVRPRDLVRALRLAFKSTVSAVRGPSDVGSHLVGDGHEIAHRERETIAANDGAVGHRDVHEPVTRVLRVERRHRLQHRARNVTREPLVSVAVHVHRRGVDCDFAVGEVGRGKRG